MVKSIVIFFLILLFTPAFVAAHAQNDPADECAFFGHDILPQEALELLKEAKNSSCPQCVKANRKKANTLLNKSLRPGKIFCVEKDAPLLVYSRTPSLLFLEAGLVPEGYPKIAVQFHTEQRHWPGVEKEDFTDDALAALLQERAGGLCFVGKISLVACPYGDGDVFYFDSTAYCLVVHIRFLKTTPVSCP
jgi:hypothetical protein